MTIGEQATELSYKLTKACTIAQRTPISSGPKNGEQPTSILYYIVVRYSWGWSKWRAGAPLALFLTVDIPFLLANLFKFFEGGYIPMLIGAALIAGMLIWSRGRTALMEQYSTRYPTLEAAKPFIRRWLCSRVPGTAVFLAPSPDHVPPILVHHVGAQPISP